MKNLKSKIEYCLNKYPKARNCDVTLTLYVWYEFHRKSIIIMDNDEYYVKLSDIKLLPREDAVKRMRAKFNSKGQYLPTDKSVLKRRGLQEEKWRSHLGYNPELRKIYN